MKKFMLVFVTLLLGASAFADTLETLPAECKDASMLYVQDILPNDVGTQFVKVERENTASNAYDVEVQILPEHGPNHEAYYVVTFENGDGCELQSLTVAPTPAR